jgi:organic hydroperoxide reductase OsmC/OhrA
MWKYEIAVDWEEEKIGQVGAEGKSEFKVATPPEFGGPENQWTPEDLLAASVASCVMTSTLFFTNRSKIEMDSYQSKAIATMEKTPAGLAITAIQVLITVQLKDVSQSEAMQKAVDMAKKNCPVSAALNCPVKIELSIA